MVQEGRDPSVGAPAALLLAAIFAFPAWAAPAPQAAAVKALPGEPVDLKAVDGWTLKAAYSPAAPGKATLVLLHGTGQRKEDWRRLAFPLARAGYGVLAVDMRGHGESRVAPSGEPFAWKQLRASKAANDYVDMARDAEAGAAWLAGQGVPEESIGFIGAEVGGSVALRYAATHPKVPLVAVLSPGMKWQEVLTVNAVRAMKRPTPTPILMVYSEADRVSSREAPILHAFAKVAVGDRYASLIVVPHERGTRMLKAQRDLAARITAWLGSPVQPEAPAASTQAPAAVSTQAPAALPEDDAED